MEAKTGNSNVSNIFSWANPINYLNKCLYQHILEFLVLLHFNEFLFGLKNQ